MLSRVDPISIISVFNVIIVTLPPDPGDAMISDLQQRVLQAMEEKRAKGVILDISEVEIVDSYFARTVAETAQMVLAMGGETVITGMQPSVAITTAQLGFSLGNARTALNVDQAMTMLRPLWDKGRS